MAVWFIYYLFVCFFHFSFLHFFIPSLCANSCFSVYSFSSALAYDAYGPCLTTFTVSILKTSETFHASKPSSFFFTFFSRKFARGTSGVKSWNFKSMNYCFFWFYSFGLLFFFIVRLFRFFLLCEKIRESERKKLGEEKGGRPLFFVNHYYDF